MHTHACMSMSGLPVRQPPSEGREVGGSTLYKQERVAYRSLDSLAESKPPQALTTRFKDEGPTLIARCY